MILDAQHRSRSSYCQFCSLNWSWRNSSQCRIWYISCSREWSSPGTRSRSCTRRNWSRESSCGGSQWRRTKVGREADFGWGNSRRSDNLESPQTFCGWSWWKTYIPIHDSLDSGTCGDAYKHEFWGLVRRVLGFSVRNSSSGASSGFIVTSILMFLLKFALTWFLFHQLFVYLFPHFNFLRHYLPVDDDILQCWNATSFKINQWETGRLSVGFYTSVSRSVLSQLDRISDWSLFVLGGLMKRRRLVSSPDVLKTSRWLTGISPRTWRP